MRCWKTIFQGGSDTDATFFLVQDGVTKIAVFLHDLAFGAHMLAKRGNGNSR